ncbi:uncharacterized protein LOC62_04G005642 [Vanrija pseudolonga]|uniref:Uncharacterized protein n=1 Tax=Vanrija pseudolonga TaxID=143232 RepID=A0AAF1BLE9_9TREE|nr:hypothetical protein LOC62_04G005642 [Vanrija pseudolonga]
MGSSASRPAPPPAPSPPASNPERGKKGKSKAKAKQNAPPTYKQAVKGGSKQSKQRNPDPSSPSTAASSPSPQTPVLSAEEAKKQREQALKDKKKAEKKARSELKKATAAQAKAEKIAQEAPQRIEDARLKAAKKAEKLQAKASKRAEKATARAAEATGVAANYGTSPVNPPPDWKPPVAIKTSTFVTIENDFIRQKSAPPGWEPPRPVYNHNSSSSRSAPVSPAEPSFAQRSPPNLPPRRAATASKVPIPGAYPRVPPRSRLPDYATGTETDTLEYHANHRKLALEREYAEIEDRRGSR